MENLIDNLGGDSIRDFEYESDLRETAFYVYFERKKHNLIDDMKSFGETHRLPKMIIDMERVKSIYKEYFEAGFTACWIRAEKEISDLTKANECYDDAFINLSHENARLKKLCERYKNISQELEGKFEYLESVAISHTSGKCTHKSDGSHLLSNPPKTKCKKCGEFYSVNKLKG